MKVNNNQNYQNFRGKPVQAVGNFIAKHPVAIAGLAGSSVIAQKVIMSGSEAVVGPMMDVATGKAITKVTKEEDGRTNESSKTQAIRTFSQSVGGTMTGVAVRALCIMGATYLASKGGGVIGETLAKTQNKYNLKNNSYINEQNAKAWGKSIGGAIAIGVMMFTNFLLDVPLVNWINKKATKIVSGKNTQEKEVK